MRNKGTTEKQDMDMDMDIISALRARHTVMLWNPTVVRYMFESLLMYILYEFMRIFPSVGRKDT